MLVEFAIDTDAIQDDEHDPLAADDALRRLVELWEKFGTIVFGERDGQKSHIFEAVESLSPEPKRLWKKALVHNRRRELSQAWGGPVTINSPDEVDSVCRIVLPLDCVLFSEMRAEILGLGNNYSILSPARSVEMARYKFPHRAECFEKCINLDGTFVEIGTSCDDVWNSRFETIASHATKIVLIDAFAYIELLESKSDESGLEQLCRKLTGSAEGCVLEVYSAFIDRQGRLSITSDQYRKRLQELKSKYVNGGVDSAQFYLCENRDFRPEAHYRSLRFDSTVCYLDTGIKVLRKGGVDSKCRLSIGARGKAENNAEKYLYSRRSGKPEGW